MTDPGAVQAKRENVKAAIGAVRGAIEGDLGVAPRSNWLLPLVAAALGLTAGLSVRRAFKTRRSAKRISGV